MRKVKRWICSACGANHFVDIAEARGKCPNCGGSGEVKDVYVDDAGVIHARQPD